MTNPFLPLTLRGLIQELQEIEREEGDAIVFIEYTRTEGGFYGVRVCDEAEAYEVAHEYIDGVKYANRVIIRAEEK